MRTATIDYSDFEVLVGAGVALAVVLENALPTIPVEEKPGAEKTLAEIRGALEKSAANVTEGWRPKTFLERIAEAKAARGTV